MDVLLDAEEMVTHDKPYDPHNGMRRDNAGFHSEEFDDGSDCSFQFVDKEHHHHHAPPAPRLATVVQHQHQVGFKSEEEVRQHFRLLSSGTSEDDEDDFDNLIGSGDGGVKYCGGGGSDSPDGVVVVPPPGGEEEQFLIPSNCRAVVNRCGGGKGSLSLSSRSDPERAVAGKTAAAVLRQNSLQDTLATEMEIHHHSDDAAVVVNDNENENENAAVVNVNKVEDGPPKCKKRVVDSFLAGIIKKSFKDVSSKPDEEGWKKSVTVNGRVIPDKLVKKAEKLAGPINPGRYWYDYRAGFWGVIGGPCLGIIPPHIEEFHYPMEHKCAGGNTEVFVNGRELHQKDLDLLASRGLPTTKHRSYIIEISGRVLDEDSGEELDSLGKLAPTVEKVKHGFGMSTPKILA